MFYLSPLWLARLVNIAHLNVLHVYVSSTSDMELHLSFALGSKMDMASLTLLISKSWLFHAEKQQKS